MDKWLSNWAYSWINFTSFGSKGGLSWKQEQPNQLFWTPINDSQEL